MSARPQPDRDADARRCRRELARIGAAVDRRSPADIATYRQPFVARTITLAHDLAPADLAALTTTELNDLFFLLSKVQRATPRVA